MPEFRVIKRTDVPRAFGGMQASPPSARLSKTGALCFSALATEALSNTDCRVMAEFDEETRVLKFSVADQLPQGIAADDCFTFRIRQGSGQRPSATVSVRSIFSYIGFKPNGIRVLEIVDLDPMRHSISLLLPECEN